MAWGSVKDGRWHITLSDEPSFMKDDRSLCGLSFRPFNVIWDTDDGHKPNPRYICHKCEAKNAIQRRALADQEVALGPVPMSYRRLTEPGEDW